MRALALLRWAGIGVVIALAGCAGNVMVTGDATTTADATTLIDAATTSTTDTANHDAAATTTMSTADAASIDDAQETVAESDAVSNSDTYVDCGPTACFSMLQSKITLIGTIAFADTDVSELTIAVCRDWECYPNLTCNPDAEPTFVDDSGLEITDNEAYCSIAKTAPGQYAVKYVFIDEAILEQPQAMTVTIDSGGTTLYTESVPIPTFDIGCQPCGGSYLLDCTLEL